MVLAGRVQGVGFRPFVLRQAASHGLRGWVRNGAGRVEIHAEGLEAALAGFEAALIAEAPPLSRPCLAQSRTVPEEGFGAFAIIESEAGGIPDNHLPPDLFCCDDCLAELGDPAARRYRYAFTNCTQCGPRYTIISALPYDRPLTSMAGFGLCTECRREYEDPGDRRFHAEPLACPQCGPVLSLREASGSNRRGDALSLAIARLKAGAIVAVKGVGGYHLMCDPTDDAAVGRLRARKKRPDKPLAVMFPLDGPDGLAAVRHAVRLGTGEEAALRSPERPIVLAAKQEPFPLSTALAPGLNELGVFLPYAPLHFLLLEGFGGPLVATSGNASGEPVVFDNQEAFERLRAVADAFLDHDRPVLRPADDPVVRIIGGAASPLRLGRGNAPLEIDLPFAFEEPTLAVGGHQKTTVALGWGRRAVVSPHVGDLDSPISRAIFERVIDDLQALYGVAAARIACDAHPNYASTRWAERSGLPVTRVQHHRAHSSGLAVEHPGIENWLVFAWDGVGYGSDGSLWGGEGFAGRPGCWRRVAGVRPFRVTGGDMVAREPWRSAAGLMWQAGRRHCPRADREGLVARAWDRGLASAETSSAGRLFDAAAALVLGCERTSFEGQGAMALEAAAGDEAAWIELPLEKGADDVVRFDWAPLLDPLADERRPIPERAALFHESLAAALAAQVAAVMAAAPVDAVGLTGGVFQNRRLVESIMARLAPVGVPVLVPRLAPANDGGLSLGQLVEAQAAGSIAGPATRSIR